jgi:septum formation protein
MKLILGSTSPYRKELLQKLGLSFAVDSPDIDETMLEAEQPE